MHHVIPELAHMDDRRARELLASQALRIILLLVSIVGLIMFFISPILTICLWKKYNQAISLFNYDYRHSGRVCISNTYQVF